ncbi:Maf family nucleotide pyrophosphatase [Hydromonas duriensis]|uniref:7-methyl-GTP pyrophosphatase n=1 Tax=Hydromonas duriensis TaxID=1527608 RepID=A0A4R6Y773_9BURK|nr:Maf family nucleotide pyrophosphatase [Hydromonas duriensis]TDR31166.1 septum formation protein [Hydromonas duriensis]
MTTSTPPLILGSSSKYRQELLTRLHLPFVVVSPNIDETPQENETPTDTALRLALEKARDIAKLHPDALIIGADQVATVDGVQLGKAGNHANALKQLQMMRGKTVQFHSALCLFDARRQTYDLRDIVTLATVRDLSDEELSNYLHIEQPYDCAGSAKVEGLGISILEKVESDDPTALIGLPLIALTDMLRAAGVVFYRAEA